MNTKLKLVGAVLARVIIGIPLLALVVAALYTVGHVVTLAVANPVITLTTFVVVVGLFTSYCLGNMAVKEYRIRKVRRENRRS